MFSLATHLMVAICSAQYRLTVFACAGQTRLSARFHFNGASSSSRARFTICKSDLVTGGLTLESSPAHRDVVPCAAEAAKGESNEKAATEEVAMPFPKSKNLQTERTNGSKRQAQGNGFRTTQEIAESMLHIGLAADSFCYTETDQSSGSGYKFLKAGKTPNAGLSCGAGSSFELSRKRFT